MININHDTIKYLFDQDDVDQFKRGTRNMEFSIISNLDSFRDCKHFKDYIKLVINKNNFMHFSYYKIIVKYLVEAKEYEFLLFMQKKTKYTNNKLSSKIIKTYHKDLIINYFKYNNAIVNTPGIFNGLSVIGDDAIQELYWKGKITFGINVISEISSLFDKNEIIKMLDAYDGIMINNKSIKFIETNYPNYIPKILEGCYLGVDFNNSDGKEIFAIKLFINQAKENYSLRHYFKKFKNIIRNDYFINDLEFFTCLIDNYLFHEENVDDFMEWYLENGSIYADKIINKLCNTNNHKILEFVLRCENFIILDREYLITNHDNFNKKIQELIKPFMYKPIKSARNY